MPRFFALVRRGRRSAARSPFVALAVIVAVFAQPLAALPAPTPHPSDRGAWANMVRGAHAGNASATVNPKKKNTTTFTAQNLGTQAVTVNFVATACSGMLKAGSCSASPATRAMNPGDEVTVTATFTGGLASGTGTLTIAAKNASTGLQLAASSVTVTVTGAGNPPTVNTAYHTGDRIDTGLCLADCFETTFGYSTPAYISRDVPRSVSLLYRSGQAKPYGRLMLDVYPAQSGPTSFQLQLQNPNGANITFTNGSQSLYFIRDTLRGTRIAAEFDASTIVTSAGLYTAYVTAFQGSTQVGVTAVPLRIIVINDRTSEYGAGVELVGVQRIYTGQTGGVLVTDGTGSASFFAGSCTPPVTCTFTPPAGDFSVLSTGGSTYKRTYKDGTVVTFNSTGLETSAADRFGNTTSYAWVYNGDAGRYVLSTITDPATQPTSFIWRNSGNANGWKVGTLGAITAPGNRMSNFGVNAANDLQVAQDPDGGWFASLGYDTQHRLTIVHDKKQGVWDYAYAYGKTPSYVDAPSVVLATQGSQRPRTQVREPYAGLYLAAIAGSGATLSTAIPVPTFDIRAAITDPRGISTFYSLNRFGSPQKTYAPLIPADSVEYIQSTGQVIRTISPTGHEVRYVWSGSQLTVVNDVTLGKVDSLWYKPVFDLPAVIRGASGAQYFWYDSLKSGWPLMQTRQSEFTNDPAVTHYADPSGRDTAVADQLGHRTSYRYATSGFRNLDTVRTLNTQLTTFTHDAYGRTVSSKNPYGVIASTGYDVLNRVTWSTATSAHDTTFFWYDALDADTLTQDAKGQKYTSVRNALGWVVKQIDPANHADSSEYDVGGQVVHAKSRANREVTFLYDSAGRVTRQSNLAGTDAIVYSYDPAGKWVATQSIVANVVVSTDTIATADQAHADTVKTYRPGVGSWRLVHTFNSSDPGLSNTNLYSPVTATTPATYTYYTYDALKRLSRIRTPLDTTTFAYNDENLLVADTLRSGLVETRDYTPNHQLSNRSYVGASVVDSVLGRWYGSDSLARVIQRGDTTRFYQTFAYDSAGRLNSWLKKARGNTPNCVNTDGYGYVCSGTLDTTKLLVLPTYDKVGNPSDLGATLDAGNRLRVFNGATMAYDPDGFMVKRQTSTTADSLVCDDFGRLVSVIRTVPSSSTTTFTYDGFGRRIKKVVTGTGATTVQYLWDGDQILLEMDANGTTTQTYAYYPGVDQPRSVAVSNVTYFMSTEADGSINGVVRKSDKSIVAQYAYTPWGELEQDANFVVGGVRVNGLRWKGLSYDQETGLYYVRARYYDPRTRRFLSEDPIGLDGGINEYAFVGGDPINSSDPSGLLPDVQYLPGVNTTAQWGFIGCWGRVYTSSSEASEPFLNYAQTQCPSEPSISGPQGYGPSAGTRPQAPSAPTSSHPIRDKILSEECGRAALGLAFAGTMDALTWGHSGILGAFAKGDMVKAAYIVGENAFTAARGLRVKNIAGTSISGNTAAVLTRPMAAWMFTGSQTGIASAISGSLPTLREFAIGAFVPFGGTALALRDVWRGCH
jgi:RHS repeat-associated protein